MFNGILDYVITCSKKSSNQSIIDFCVPYTCYIRTQFEIISFIVKMLYLKGFIISCCIFLYSAQLLQQNSVYDDTLDNKYHLSNAVRHSTVTSLSHCAMLCLQYMRCLSYFYNTQSHECILHAISFKHTVPSFAGIGWKFYLTEDGKLYVLF